MIRPLGFLIAIFALSSVSAKAAGTCGDSVEVRRGDTLSAIAERCDVSEKAILRSNPGIEGSGDLRAGLRLELHQDVAGRALNALGSATREGADALAGLARDVKSSASDLLDKNPDLRKRIEDLEKSVDGKPKTQRGSVSLSLEDRRPPELRVQGHGLPPNIPVIVGLGAPGTAYESVSKTRTTADGTLDVVLNPPDWARGGRVQAVVGGEANDWTIRSEPVALAGP